jgi:hypothetical protein
MTSVMLGDGGLRAVTLLRGCICIYRLLARFSGINPKPGFFGSADGDALGVALHLGGIVFGVVAR